MMLRSCFWSTPASHPQWGVRGAHCTYALGEQRCEVSPTHNTCEELPTDRTICLRSHVPQSWPFGNCPQTP